MESKSSYLDQYRIIKTLGSGYHAKVKLAEAPDKTLVAIKRFKGETANLDTLKHELTIMKKLHHDNLVNLIDVRENATYRKKTGETYNCFAIVLEYVGGGELFDFVAIGGKFSEVASRTYFYQLMNAVHYMHEKGYAHRDIKPENILLTEKYLLKLADFGFATLWEGKDKSEVLHTKLGTEGYMAPEVQTKNYDGRKADIFSCGVILFIMYTASPPFERSVPNDPYYKLIKDKNFTTFWSYHSKKKPIGFFSNSFKNLIEKMLAFDPNERPTMLQISQHEWIKEKVVSLSSLQEEFETRKKKVDGEMEKQRLDRQKKRDDMREAIYNPTKINRTDNHDAVEFKQHYEKQEGAKRTFDCKPQIFQCDCVIKESEDFVFANLSVYLSKPIVIDDVVFTPKYTQSNNKLHIIYEFEYGEEGLKQTVDIELCIFLQKDKNMVLCCKRLGGSMIYYKKLVLLLQNEFCYCNVCNE